VLSTLAGSRVIYTPEVFLNLQELRGWDSEAQFRRAVNAVNARPARAGIRLVLDAASSGQLPVSASFAVKSGISPKRAQAFVALYESGFVTAVAAGENRGATLRHDNVVRKWIGPIDLVEGSAEFRTVLSLDRGTNPKHLAVAAFVQDSASGELLQATALPLCGETS